MGDPKIDPNRTKRPIEYKTQIFRFHHHTHSSSLQLTLYCFCSTNRISKLFYLQSSTFDCSNNDAVAANHLNFFAKIKSSREKMRRLLGKISGFLSNRNMVGQDKAGNRYFTRKEELDGIMKEKRWVIFKGEEDPTSIPVEWICWLNGQRKKAPTPEEMMELEARRERVKQNVALLKKEEEERRAKEGSRGKRVGAGGPDLKSFIRQFPVPSEGNEVEESPGTMAGSRNPQENTAKKAEVESESSEPTRTGATFRPGTWQPPI